MRIRMPAGAVWSLSGRPIEVDGGARLEIFAEGTPAVLDATWASRNLELRGGALLILSRVHLRHGRITGRTADSRFGGCVTLMGGSALILLSG